MRNSLRRLAEFVDDVDQPMTLRSLIDKHRWAPGTAMTEKSLRTVHRRHNNEQTREIRLLTLNTYLMDVWSNIGGSKKPAVEDRAPRIGALVKDNFDIALLNEIFEDNVKDKVLAAWVDSGSRPHVVEDAEPRTNQSSGLVTISRWPLVDLGDRKFHEFDNESGLAQDGLADKGIMLSPLPLEFGDSQTVLLELYGTHLDASEANVRSAQVRELTAFITRTHASGNIAVLAGDFNIDDRTPEYDHLRDSLLSVGMVDIWAARNGTPGFTYPSDSQGVTPANAICTPDPSNPLYCDDSRAPTAPLAGSRRIDYIFVSEPRDDDAYVVDFSRPRRVRHERRPDAPEREKIAFLSDHLGLSTTLLVSPR